MFIKRQFAKFEQDVKVMRHRLRCIGGPSESHHVTSNKGPIEMDVIPNTVVFLKVPVQDKLCWGARLVFRPEPGFYIPKRKPTRREQIIEVR